MSDEGRPACEIHRDENGDVFVLVGGTKIAKRGLPDTAHANTWIMLEPGWMVREVKGGKAIEVRYEPTRMPKRPSGGHGTAIWTASYCDWLTFVFLCLEPNTAWAIPSMGLA
jgi:hypothetical protein